MAKILLNDEEIIDIVQLASRQEIANNTEEKIDSVEAEIIKRMSEKSLNWYINNIVPVVGRPILKKKWSEIRNKN